MKEKKEKFLVIPSFITIIVIYFIVILGIITVSTSYMAIFIPFYLVTCLTLMIVGYSIVIKSIFKFLKIDKLGVIVLLIFCLSTVVMVMEGTDEINDNYGCAISSFFGLSCGVNYKTLPNCGLLDYDLYVHGKCQMPD